MAESAIIKSVKKHLYFFCAFFYSSRQREEMGMKMGNHFYCSDRKKNDQYKRLLEEIVNDGHRKSTVQLVDALTILGPKPMRFNLAEEGIPLITERDLAVGKPPLWKQAIAEIIAFINGAQTLHEIEQYGCFFWSRGNLVGEEKCSRFGLQPGDFGPGFYGNSFRRFPKADGGTFDQLSEVLKQIVENPKTRTHFISPWVPQCHVGKGRNTVITACAGWMYFEVDDDKISLVMVQRAADASIGVPFNTFQYAVLLLMVAQATNLRPHEFVHQIIDAHIYANQMPAVEAMLAREDRAFPIIEVNPDIKNLFDFRADDFVLKEYNPHPAIRGIPVADA